MDALQDKVNELASEFGVPGVAVGVLQDGQEQFAFAGVTSVENPLPVDASTLFQFGSTGKTYTATALVRLAEQGKLDLGAPVQRYVPELRLKGEGVAGAVTVLQLLNHTAGWEGDLMEDMGSGDDSLARYVTRMADLEQVTPLGSAVSYNNASLSLAGRVIEQVTGTTYEQAIDDLLLTPLGLSSTLFFPQDIITRRFTVGHTRHEDGRTTIAQPWAMPRSSAPAGGMSATAADQIAWARFHLGDGTAPDGTRLLSADSLASMQQPTVHTPGSALGDAVGISWLLGEVDGVATVAHGGTTHGQHSQFLLVPERGFAVIAMTNSGPNGPQFNNALVAWALEHFLDLVAPVREPVQLSEAETAAYTGRYETIAVLVDVAGQQGRLSVQVTVKPHMAAMLNATGEPVPEQPPILLDMLSGPPDRFVHDEGTKGYFARGADGAVSGIHLGGRLATRSALAG